MIIAICGSMQFSAEMLDYKSKLESLGHKVTVPEGTEEFVKDNKYHEDKWTKIEIDPFKEYFKVIDKSDAILVINKEKKNIPGYVGGNSLIEMAFAHVLEKKIYLIEEIPDLSYTDEIFAMKPIIIKHVEDIK